MQIELIDQILIKFAGVKRSDPVYYFDFQMFEEQKYLEVSYLVQWVFRYYLCRVNSLRPLLLISFSF